MKFTDRKAGVLLHPTSLPGDGLNGEFGAEAYHFIDFIRESGFKMWQVLPMGPTHDDNSPYQCLSAHAGDTKLISISQLLTEDWVDVDLYQQFHAASFAGNEINKSVYLRHLLTQFDTRASEVKKQLFVEFQNTQQFWLKDFSLFVLLRTKYANQSWVAWPDLLREHDDSALDDVCLTHVDELRLIMFGQFVFFQQWLALKKYANDRGIELFGDIPLFVAHDSADVWANRKLFKLNAQGHTNVVAGVPPDYFSETGQRWGNPLYDWQAIAETGYQWWIQRLATQFELFDLLRIDHFRGLEAYWEIPAEHDTAMNGYWVKGPGQGFFDAVSKHFANELPLVAEDLGFITEEVHQLRSDVELPGMKILQFAFDSDALNPYLPHYHERQSVVYTGTHDNDTTLGWYQGLSDEVKNKVLAYYDEPTESFPWLLIRSAFASVASLAIIPMQDIMALDTRHRMNVPGTVEGNWCWRFEWQDVDKDLIKNKVQSYARLYAR